MESDNQKKSLTDEYLGQNRSEAQIQVNIDSSTFRPAPLGKRLMAFFIDKLILFVVTTFIPFVVFRMSHGLSFMPFIINLLADFVYAGYFYSTYSATPGKMIFNLQVLKDSGDKLNFIKAGLRDGVGKSISGLIIGAGYLMAFFREDRHALHDLMFKTKVVLKN
jgi:uncharacterized RDD family membrane protein YckC